MGIRTGATTRRSHVTDPAQPGFLPPPPPASPHPEASPEGIPGDQSSRAGTGHPMCARAGMTQRLRESVAETDPGRAQAERVGAWPGQTDERKWGI